MTLSELEALCAEQREIYGDVDVALVRDTYDVSAWSIEKVDVQERAPISRRSRDGKGKEYWCEGYSDIASTALVVILSSENDP